MDVIGRRQVTEEDTSLLYQVYREAREEEMMEVGWTPTELEIFLRMQFDMQRRSYALQHLEACHEVIMLEQVPIGQMMTKVTDHCVWIIDIALCTGHRNKGIGTRLIQEVQVKAAKMGKAVRLHVLYNNPAQHLYERLGFYVSWEKYPYIAMEWLPGENTGEVTLHKAGLIDSLRDQ